MLNHAASALAEAAPQRGAGSAVRLENVTQRFGRGQSEVVALDHVTLQIAEGEFVAIMGPSGSGKSTLLNLIGALDRPTEGRIVIADRDIAGLSVKEAARYRRREVGFVFQSFNLLPRLTVLENVALPLVFDGVAPSERVRRARASLEALHMSDRLSHLPNTLSGGEKQRVAIARALINSPRLLLADEPTGNLDSKNAAAVVSLLVELNRTQGQTVILITHNLEVAEAAGRTVQMRDGHIVMPAKGA